MQLFYKVAHLTCTGPIMLNSLFSLESCLSDLNIGYQQLLDDLRSDFSQITIRDEIFRQVAAIVDSPNMSSFTPTNIYLLELMCDAVDITELHFELEHTEDASDRDDIKSDIYEFWLQQPFNDVFLQKESDSDFLTSSEFTLNYLLKKILGIFMVRIEKRVFDDPCLYELTPELGDTSTSINLYDANCILPIDKNPETFPSILIRDFKKDSLFFFLKGSWKKSLAQEYPWGKIPFSGKDVDIIGPDTFDSQLHDLLLSAFQSMIKIYPEFVSWFQAFNLAIIISENDFPTGILGITNVSIDSKDANILTRSLILQCGIHVASSNILHNQLSDDESDHYIHSPWTDEPCMIEDVYIQLISNLFLHTYILQDKTDLTEIENSKNKIKKSLDSLIAYEKLNDDYRSLFKNIATFLI